MKKSENCFSFPEFNILIYFAFFQVFFFLCVFYVFYFFIALDIPSIDITCYINIYGLSFSIKKNKTQLYIEEILSSSSAIWMSTDGYLMLYGSFNDSLVEEQKFSWFGTTNPIAADGYLYPEIRSLR